MDYQQAASLLSGKDNILILTHRRPDGDTIGCAAALCLGLRQLGKTAWLLPNEEAHGLFTPYLEGMSAPEGFSGDFIVSVDIASIELLPDNAAQYQDCIDLNLDHHGSNCLYARENCVDSSCAACGELLYQILSELGPISSQMALLLYVAISTDTGCFVFSNTTAQSHRIAAALFDIGLDYNWVNKRHFRTKSLRRLKLESIMVQDMLLLDEGHTAIASIPLSIMAELSATEEDVDNIAAFLEQISGVEVAATVREISPGECKISLRTDASLNASDVCALLGGGGHPSAAGCSVMGSIEYAQKAIISAIESVRRDGNAQATR